MKKGFSLLLSIVFLFTLSGCEEKTYTLECVLEGYTYTYDYDEEKLLAYYFEDVLYEDGTTVDGVYMDYEEYVNEAGGIDQYIRNVQFNMEAMGGICTKD